MEGFPTAPRPPPYNLKFTVINVSILHLMVGNIRQKQSEVTMQSLFCKSLTIFNICPKMPD